MHIALLSFQCSVSILIVRNVGYRHYRRRNSVLNVESLPNPETFDGYTYNLEICHFSHVETRSIAYTTVKWIIHESPLPFNFAFRERSSTRLFQKCLKTIAKSSIH